MLKSKKKMSRENRSYKASAHFLQTWDICNNCKIVQLVRYLSYMAHVVLEDIDF